MPDAPEIVSLEEADAEEAGETTAKKFPMSRTSRTSKISARTTPTCSSKKTRTRTSDLDFDVGGDEDR